MRRLIIASSLLSTSYILYNKLKKTAKLSSVPRCGICILFPTTQNSNFQGILSLRQLDLNSPIEMVCNLTGLNKNSSYALSVHEFGDLTKGVENLGKKVESQEEKFGEVKSDKNGNAIAAWKKQNFSLFGVATIFGKGCSISKEQKKDDIIGVGTIARAKEFVNIAQPQNQQ